VTEVQARATSARPARGPGSPTRAARFASVDTTSIPPVTGGFLWGAAVPLWTSQRSATDTADTNHNRPWVDEEEVEQKIQGQVNDLKSAGLNVSYEHHGAAAGGAAHAIADATKGAGGDLIGWAPEVRDRSRARSGA
jgi:hypothetical protein